tara:strand:- start:4804 stop:5511 length:708 start_codon:yes stop_codon:yes gene_type:complete
MGAPMISIPLSCESNNSLEKKKSIISSNDIILFQGDSITDSNREKIKELPNNPISFGEGYPFLIASELLFKNPKKKLQIYNRGISGNKVPDLDIRWEKDCISLKPSVLSIMIGINDFWHVKDLAYDGTPKVFENGYRNLLKKTKNYLPNTKIIICEPFILLGTSIDKGWPEEFKEYQKIVKNLSDEFQTVWVPFQEVFNKALEYAPVSYWAPDGVHPSIAGSQLMANAWVNKIYF